MRYLVGFEHTSGGDSLLPQGSRGYYDEFTATVEADTPEEAEGLAMRAMYDDRSENHPDFPNRAVDDLVARVEEIDR
jgi:hypothetical protein